jgi:hypothetical protein
MRSFNFAPLPAVVMFSLGLVVGVGLLGGLAREANAVPEALTTKSMKAACTSGDAVADFVCRNTWMANTRHSYR